MKKVWCVTVNLISIIIVLAIFSSLYDSEFLILSSLVIFIYVALEEKEIVDYNRFKTQTLLFTNYTPNITSEEKTDVDKLFKKNNFFITVNSIGLIIIFVIALLNLINNL